MRYGMGVTSVWVWGLCLAEAWTMCFTMGVVGAVEERGTVKGLVVGEGGQPIAGARVRALRISDVEPFDPFSPDLHAETDSVGRFEAQLRPGEYIAVVTKGLLTSDGAPEEARSWEVKAGRTLEVRIPLRNGGRIRGIAVNEDGKPVGSAKVVLENGLTTKTDGEGKFEFEGVGFGKHEIEVRSGLARGFVGFNTSGQECYEARVEMSPGYRVRGKVTDGKGQPVRGAVVRDYYSGHWVFQRFSVTDKDGNYELSSYSFGQKLWAMGVWHPEFAESSKHDLSPPEKGDVLVVDFLLTEGYGVEGHVYGPDGKPVKDALVGNGFPGSHAEYTYARTDEKGYFRLARIPEDDEQSVVVQAKGYAPACQKVTPVRGAGTPKLTFKLTPGRVGQGRVVDRAGRPLAGVNVNPWVSITGACGHDFIGARAQTGKDGRFRIEDLPASGVFVDVYARGYSTVRQRPLALDGENAIVMDPPGVIVGKVVDETTREPVKAFRVRLDFSKSEKRPDTPQPSFSAALSDGGQDSRSEDGRFTISDMVCRAPHAVIVHTEGYAPTRIDPVVAQPADWPGWPVVIKVGRGDAVSGEVVDAESGKPVEAAEVFLLMSAEPLRWQFKMEVLEQPARYRFSSQVKRTDSAGRFEFKGVDKGSHLFLLFRHPHYAPAFLKNVSPAKPVEAKLVRGGNIMGILASHSNEATVRLEGGELEFDLAAIKPDGGFEFKNLPPGEYGLVIWGGKRRQNRTSVKVGSGETARVDFANLPGWKVSGLVTRAGEPMADVGMVVQAALDGYCVGTGYTDAQGRYAIRGIPPGEYVVQATEGDWVDPKRREVAKSFTIAGRDAQVDLGFHSGAISGRVVDGTTGRAFDKAWVRAFRLVESEEAPDIRWQANEHPLDRSKVSLNAFPAGLVSPRVHGLELTRGLGGVRYSAWFKNPNADTDGRFEMPNVVPGTYILTFWGINEEIPNFTPRVTIEREGQTQNVELRFDRSATLSFRVVDAETKKGIPKAGVSLCTAEGFFLASTVQKTQKPEKKAKSGDVCPPEGCGPSSDGRVIEQIESDAKGLVTVSSLQPGRYGVWVVAPGYVARWVSPLVAQRKTWLAPTATVSVQRTGALVLKPAPGMLDGLHLPFVAYRIHDSAGRVVFPGGERMDTLFGPLETAAASMAGANANGYRVDVLPPGRHSIEWEIHQGMDRSRRSGRAEPAVCGGKATFEVRKGQESVVPLAR